MPEVISAALSAFVTAAKSAVSVRKAVSSFANLLDDGQIDRLKKAIRAIYFFQGGFLAEIDGLLSRRADKKAIARSIRQRLDATDSEVKRALDVITSSSLTSNLRLDIGEVDSLREIANLKAGIRQHLRSLVDVLETKQSLRGLTVQLKKIRGQIDTICREIDKIEKLLARRGLQQAREG